MKSMADLSVNMQDLSGCVEATEEWQKEVEVPPASLNTSRPTRRMASPQGSLDFDQEVEEEVHRRVAKRMR